MAPEPTVEFLSLAQALFQPFTLIDPPVVPRLKARFVLNGGQVQTPSTVSINDRVGSVNI